MKNLILRKLYLDRAHAYFLSLAILLFLLETFFLTVTFLKNVREYYSELQIIQYKIQKGYEK